MPESIGVAHSSSWLEHQLWRRLLPVNMSEYRKDWSAYLSVLITVKHLSISVDPVHI